MSLTILLEMAQADFGDRILVQGGDRRLTPNELARLAGGAASALADGGHDFLVYLGGWGPAYATAVFAAAAAGIPLVPLNFRLGRDQLAGLLANHPKALVVAERPDVVAAAGGPDAVTPDAWLAGLADQPTVEADPAPKRPAVLLYTSGTTSAPKAAVLRHDHLVSYVMSTVEFGSATPTEAALVSVPPYHVAGLANLLSNLFAGRRMVALTKPDVAEWWATAADEQVTHAFVVPTLLKRLVDHAAKTGATAPHLRHLAYGGARTPRLTIEAALHLLPDTGFTQAYGLTETSSTIAVLGPDDHRAAFGGEDPAAGERLASVGQPVPGIEVEVRDGDSRPVADGASGRVWLRGPQVSGEYVAVAPALDVDGWFDTRDRGRLDVDGYLFLEGRDDDTIIRGAENIAPAEIEDVILAHPGVREATVVGVPDDEWGHVPAAGVVLVQPAATTAEAITDWVRERLRGSKTPAVIEIWDSLPLTDTGKVQRREVVARLTCLASESGETGDTSVPLAGTPTLGVDPQRPYDQGRASVVQRHSPEPTQGDTVTNTVTDTGYEAVMTGDDVVRKCRELAKELPERAAESEQRRRLSDVTAEELVDTGLLRLLQPASHGGLEAHPRTMFEAVLALAEGCGSTGWVAAVTAVHSWQLALFDPLLQDELWNDHTDVWVSSSYMPGGKLEKVDGGYRVSGRWSFSSGCDHATWAILGALWPQPDGPPVSCNIVVPKNDYRIDDVWHTVGLRGTGSNDVVIEDKFVPDHRVLTKDQYYHGTDGPGQVLNDGPLYRIPFPSIFPNVITASIIGMAQSMVDLNVAYIRDRVSSAHGRVIDNDPYTVAAIGEASREVDACRLQLFHNIDTLYGLAAAGEQISIDQRARVRRDQVLGTERSISAIDNLFDRAGARAISDTNPMQRVWRDAHAGRHHTVNTHERTLHSWATNAMGLGPSESVV